MNNEQLTKDKINIEAAVKCYERLKKANIAYRRNHPEKLKERSRIDYLKIKEERPEKYKQIREDAKERWRNDPDRKEKAKQRHIKNKEKMKIEQPEKYKQIRELANEKARQQYIKRKADKIASENITNTDQ